MMYLISIMIKIWSVAGISLIKSAITQINVLAYKDSTINLGCSDIITPTWSKGGMVLPVHQITGTLQHVTDSDSGIYTCLDTMTKVEVYVGGMQ